MECDHKYRIVKVDPGSKPHLTNFTIRCEWCDHTSLLVNVDAEERARTVAVFAGATKPEPYPPGWSTKVEFHEVEGAE